MRRLAVLVQHEARPDLPDEWASGNAGYLKKQFVIDLFTGAGFEVGLRSRTQGGADAMLAGLDASLARQVKKQRVDADTAAEVRARVSAVTALDELAAFARRHRLISVVDNTLLTPHNGAAAAHALATIAAPTRDR